MFRKSVTEALRRLDVRSAQRARWLGIRREVKRPSWDEAEENRLRVKEEIRRMLHKSDDFNHW